MIDYIAFDEITGVITATGTAQDENNIPVAGGIIFGAIENVSHVTHYVDVTTNTLVEKPTKPYGHFKWCHETRAWVADAAAAAQAVVSRRNALLETSDWTQLPDSPPNKDAWGVYRQALRDITTQLGFPFEVTWPTPPSN